MKKVKKKYVGKVKKGLLAKCPTCKAKGYTAKVLTERKQTYNVSPSPEGETITRNYYETKKIICVECKGTGVILWIDRIMRKV
jgi:DnaJ-class molecular chaperone